MRRALKWTKRIVLGLLAFLLVSTGIVIGVVHTAWGRNLVREQIVAALQEDFPGSTIDKLEGSPFGTLTVRGVTVMGAHEPLATIDEVRLEISLRPLISRRVVVDRLALRGVDVFVVEQSPRKEKPPPPWNIELPHITVDDARVTIKTQDGPQVIENIIVRAGVGMPIGGPIGVSAQVRASWRGTAIGANAVASIGELPRLPIVSLSYGDASLIATGVEVRATAISGVVRAFAPASVTKQLAEEIGDMLLLADARNDGATTLAATSAAARINANLVFDLAMLSVRGIIEAEEARGNAVVAIEADPTHARGIIVANATLPDQPPVSATLAIDTTLTRAQIVADARTRARPFAHVSAYAIAEHEGEDWILDTAVVHVHTRGVGGVGRIDAKLAAKGMLWPHTAIDVSGTVDGYGYRKDDLVVGHVHVDVAAKVERERQHATVHVTLGDTRKGTTKITSAEISATADVAGERIDVVLGKHRVDVAGILWTGEGGRIVVVPATITLDEVATSARGSKITASANIGRLTNALSAKVAARGVPIKGGHVDADVAVTRRGGRWGGSASVRARGIAALPDRPPVDATVDVTVAGRKVTIAATAENAELGRANIAATVIGPHDITDALAWMRLPRSAIENLAITVDAKHPVAASGELTIAAGEIRGEVHVRDIATKAGPLDADITLSGTDTIQIKAIATTEGVPPATADATLVLPAHPFDPTAWLALGRNALTGATVRATGVHIDPVLLARFGVDAPYSADVDATMTVGPGGRDASLAVDVRGLTGGKLTVPIDIKLTGATDAKGTRTDITAKSGKVAATIAASTTLTIDDALAGRARTTPISATLTFPETAASDVLGMLGQTDVLSGSVGGTVTIGGTVDAPAVRALLAARGLAVKTSSVTNKKPPTLELLEVDARYRGDRADVVITGTQGKDRLLKITAGGNPRKLESVMVALEAANFDLAPLAAFFTGPVRGARGTLSAALKIKGLDTKTGSIRGKLAIRDGRFPLSPALGTLRDATLDVEILDKTLSVKFDGRLGAGEGTIAGTVTGNVVDGMPMDARLEAKITKVAPIGALQPQISADIVGDWVNQGWVWTGNMGIRKGKVYVPPESGTDLLITGAPADMIFIDKQQLVVKKRHEPTKPFLITNVRIGNTDITVDDTDTRIDLIARGDLNVEIGDGVGIRGQINLVRGTAEIIGRRYRIENGLVDFDGQLAPKDGKPDPRLDIKLVHDFPSLTLTVNVRGRPSKPDVRMTGDPGTYTEGQLISFFAGAEPGNDDSATQAGQAVVSGSLSVLSGRLGKKVNKYLPVKFDTISYEAETSSSSGAVRFGIYRGEKSYLVWRQRLSARPDENPGEAVFEYQLKPYALIEATAGERAQGADVLLRKRW